VVAQTRLFADKSRPQAPTDRAPALRVGQIVSLTRATAGLSRVV